MLRPFFLNDFFFRLTSYTKLKFSWFKLIQEKIYEIFIQRNEIEKVFIFKDIYKKIKNF